MTHTACPCQSGKGFEFCCRPIHDNQQLATTPEMLMRARYSAFATKNIHFLVASHDSQTSHNINSQELQKWAEAAQFINLKILNTSESGPKGLVEFVAEYQEGDKTYSHHEVSHFRKKQGIWYYRDGKIL